MKVLKQVEYIGPYIEEKYILSEIQTTDATPTVIHSLDTVDDRGFQCECRVSAAPSGSDNRFYSIYEAFFQRKSGANIEFVEDDTREFTLFNSNTPRFRCLANTGTQKIDVEITGRSSVTLSWLIKITYKYRV